MLVGGNRCLFVDEDYEEVAAAADAADDDGDNASTSSNTSTAYTAGIFPQVADDSNASDWQLRPIRSGRRANICKGSQGCMLDAERYINLLDKQKQHTGGVLATSTIDAWECSSRNNNISNLAVTGPDTAAAARAVLQLKQHVTGQSAGLSNSNSAAAAAAATGSGEPYAAANSEPTAGVTTGRRRRSKSAHAWLQESLRRH